MKILILGAGQVGTSVAASLVSEANDITVVDQKPELLRDLQDRFDLRTVLGHAAHPDVLVRAGAEDADMLVAVTNSDETNMVACQVAYTLFRTPTKIARVRSQGFLDYPQLFAADALPIDVQISPEQLVTEHIMRLIENPGALQVQDFANGRVRLVAVKAYYGGPLVGQELRTLYDHMPEVDARVAAIYRQDRALHPEGNTIIEADDEVFFIAAPKHIRGVMSELRRLEKPYKRVMIAGSGNIGTRLARALEQKFRVKVIDHNLDRCKHIAEDLERTIVLQGDAADEELLIEENVENTDVFCAVTNDDEANILSAMLAKRLGARKVMALINRSAYVDLVQSGPIDVAISPPQATIGSLLKHVRRGDIVAVHSLRRGAAEAIEAIAHGDENSSKVVGRAVEHIDLPKGASIGAIVRGEEVVIAHHDTLIESQDHVILFLQDKRRVPEVEKLFQVAVTFYEMKPAAIQKVLGLLLTLFSLSMLPPVLVSLIYRDGVTFPFLIAFALILSTGLLIWLPVYRRKQDLRLRDGFLVVVLFWTVLGLSGSLPFILADHPHLSVTDAIFESMSGLTTTGATVIHGIDDLPRSILYYRQQLQWLGGMGIIVLAVAVLPILGIGGMQLYRAETPGPMKDSKLTPRITETAKALWYLYLGLTLACGAAYWVAGMSLFDAVGHAFSTVAIGGFSTHDASIGFFDNRAIEMIAVVFMLLAGANFALHYVAWSRKLPTVYLRDSEFRFYFFLMSASTLVVTLALYYTDTYLWWSDAFSQGLFQVVSIGTTTGFTTAEFYFWPPFLQILLLFASFVGGCAGSTGGGIKVIRFLLLIKQGMREITRLIHPNAQIPVRAGAKSVNSRVMDAVWGFFSLYVASFTVMYLALAATGLDLMTSFSAVAACINNLGPGLARVGATYAELHDPPKWILCFAMLLGRLEIFTLLVLLSPAFWRR